ncbi:MAG: site-specific DNA-methyltransferase [Caulobacteraceae bacterium]
MPKQKLELTWIDKEQRPNLEPRVLVEDPLISYRSQAKGGDGQLNNMLIHGDNLLALKALESAYVGSVKLAYIDPPFNTGQAFEHYNDGVEHSAWLNLISARIALIHSLLSDDGSIWVHLDDHEVHRARCLLDEAFGTRNFVATVIWEKADSPRMDARLFSGRHDYIIVYARNIDLFEINKVNAIGEGVANHYNKLDGNRQYYLKPLRAMGADGTREARPSLFFPLIAPDGAQVYPKNPDGTDGRWRWGRERVESDIGRIEWVAGRTGWSAYFRVYADENETRPPETIWTHKEAGSNRTSKAEAKALATANQRPFDTPKPERLLRRIVEIGSNPGDLVLDSFAGSGTTGAVAHKMGRRWIMVELGDHCETHIVPRMKKVIDGEDPGGITEAVGWKGGGGFRYYRLAPSLLEKDGFGQWVISEAYNPAMLAEAMCKHFGFAYAPSVEHYWMQGRSSESDFIYVTTNSLTHEQLRAICEEVGPERTLLICCKAFQGANADAFANLTIRKIPAAVLDRCEWGKDDYSLKVASLPMAEDEDEPAETPETKGVGDAAQGSLFEETDR